MLTNLDDVYEELKKPEVTSSTKYMYSSEKTNNKNKKMSIGRIWFNMVLGDSYELVNEPVTKKLTNKIIMDILNKFGPEKASEILGRLNDEAFKIQTLIPVSFKASDFILPDFIEKMKDDMLRNEKDPVKFQQKLETIADKYLEYLKEEHSGLYDIVESGAKGGPIDIAVLLIAKGSSSDFDGKLTVPTANSINDGFTLDEFYENSVDARNKLFIRSVGSAVPGDVSRITAFANSDVKLSKKIDCGTKKTISIEVDDKLAPRLKHRYYVFRNRPKLISDTSDIIGKTINLRSPLYCIAKDGICETCYGKSAEVKDIKTIGLTASSVIGTAILNGFAMKSRHLSSSVNFSNTDFVKDLIQ